MQASDFVTSRRRGDIELEAVATNQGDRECDGWKPHDQAGGPCVAAEFTPGEAALPSRRCGVPEAVSPR